MSSHLQFHVLFCALSSLLNVRQHALAARVTHVNVNLNSAPVEAVEKVAMGSEPVSLPGSPTGFKLLETTGLLHEGMWQALEFRAVLAICLMVLVMALFPAFVFASWRWNSQQKPKAAPRLLSNDALIAGGSWADSMARGCKAMSKDKASEDVDKADEAETVEDENSKLRIAKATRKWRAFQMMSKHPQPPLKYEYDVDLSEGSSDNSDEEDCQHSSCDEDNSVYEPELEPSHAPQYNIVNAPAL